jgi:Ni/Fe-hydrogenase subunit HybB-like protein
MMTATTLPRQPVRLSPFALWLGLLAAVMAVGGGAGLVVFWKGLSVTNLTDLVPWGLWITIDLSSIALSAGAFSLSAAVYLLGLKRFAPVARTATFVGLIGYSMAMLCLLLDIGRPDRFWKALVFWNPHSVLWEVTMCIMLYFSVLVVEVLPIFGQAGWMQQRWPRLAALLSGLHRWAPILAVAGLGLSMLHQSSLGATYGVLKARPIWNRPDLSVLFMISAIAGGQAVTVLVSMVAGRLSPRVRVNDELLEKVSSFVGWVLVVYIYFRFWDALAMTYTYLPGRTEGLRWLTKGPFSFNFWVGEMLLVAVLPSIVLLAPRLRRLPGPRMAALALVAGGVVAYRWDTTLVGQLVLLTYLPTEIVARYTTYVPSLVEVLAGAGILAYGLMAVSLGIRLLNVVDHLGGHEAAPAADPGPAPQPEPALSAAD